MDGKHIFRCQNDVPYGQIVDRNAVAIGDSSAVAKVEAGFSNKHGGPVVGLRCIQLAIDVDRHRSFAASIGDRIGIPDNTNTLQVLVVGGFRAAGMKRRTTATWCESRPQQVFTGGVRRTVAEIEIPTANRGRQRPPVCIDHVHL